MAIIGYPAIRNNKNCMDLFKPNITGWNKELEIYSDYSIGCILGDGYLLHNLPNYILCNTQTATVICVYLCSPHHTGNVDSDCNKPIIPLHSDTFKTMLSLGLEGKFANNISNWLYVIEVKNIYHSHNNIANLPVRTVGKICYIILQCMSSLILTWLYF